MKKILAILILIILLINSVCFAENNIQEIVMKEYKVIWGSSTDYNKTKEELILKGEEEFDKVEKEHRYSFSRGGEVKLQTPEEFYLGQVGYIKFEIFNNKSSDKKGFIKIINDNENLEIRNITRLFKFYLSYESVKEKETTKEKYEIEEMLDVTQNLIEYRINDENNVEGHLLLIPNGTGKYSITIQTGEENEIYDTKTIKFEVKNAPKNVQYRYQVESEIEGVVERSLNDIKSSRELNKLTKFTDGKNIGKINGEIYFNFNKKENVELQREGIINVLDDEGYFVINENGNIIENKIKISDLMEEAELEVTFVKTKDAEKYGKTYSIIYSGKLLPRVEFKNLSKTNESDNPKKEVPTKKGLLNKTIPLIPFFAIPPFLFFMKPEISLLEGDKEKYRYVTYKGGLRHDVYVDILLVKNGHENVLETIIVPRNDKIILEGLEDKHIKIKTRKMNEDGTYKYFKNYSKYTELKGKE